MENPLLEKTLDPPLDAGLKRAPEFAASLLKLGNY